jgi:hypothetical protein
MDCKYKKTFFRPPNESLCDVSGRLSPVSVAALFMDMAADEDAERRGIGLSAMGTEALLLADPAGELPSFISCPARSGP